MNWDKYIADKTEKNQTTCRHFNGIQHKRCIADVEYEVVRGSGSLPCFKLQGTAPPCASRDVMGAAEARASAEASAESLRNFFTHSKAAREAITQAHTETGANSGTILCPQCGGKLQWSRASSNGHVHARCMTTRECLAWME